MKQKIEKIKKPIKNVRASDMEKLVNCEAYAFLPDVKLKENKENTDFRDLGIKAHASCEFYLKRNFGAEVENYETRVDESLLKSCEIYTKVIEATVKKFLDDGDDIEVYVEEELSFTYKSLNFRKCIVDFALWNKTKEHLYVYDLKYSMNPPKAFENKQLGVYAAALLKRRVKKKMKGITLGICGVFSKEAWDFYEVKDMVYIKKHLDALDKLNENENYCFGEHCKYCKFLLGCPEVKKQLPKRESLDVFNNISMKELDERASLLSFFKSYIKTLEVELRERLASGDVSGHFELIETKSNRKWIDEGLVEKEFKDLEDKIYNKKLLSPAQLEKIVGKDKVNTLTSRGSYFKLQPISKEDKVEPVEFV